MLSMLSGEYAVRLPIGEANSGLILWGALIGAALGLFIGSFVGPGPASSAQRDV